MLNKVYEFGMTVLSDIIFCLGMLFFAMEMIMGYMTACAMWLSRECGGDESEEKDRLAEIIQHPIQHMMSD